MKVLTLSPMEAKESGYVPLTTPYSKKNEEQMRWFKRAFDDLKTCDIVLVEFANPESVEIWRHESELNTITDR